MGEEGGGEGVEVVEVEGSQGGEEGEYGFTLVYPQRCMGPCLTSLSTLRSSRKRGGKGKGKVGEQGGGGVCLGPW